METVTLNADYGRHKAGTEFVVKKLGTSTTVVTSPKTHKSMVLPNSVLEGLSSEVETTGTLGDIVGASLSDAEAKVLADLLRKGEEIPSVTVTPKEEAPKKPLPELLPNQIRFSTITNGRLPVSGIDYTIDTYPVDHWAEEHRVHIPKIKADHYWDTEALECLVLAHKLREKALLTGLPGTGKSSSVEQFAAWLRQPYVRLGGRGDMESSSFLGYGWADVEEVGGEMVSKMSFKPGLLTQGCLDGYLVTIDEVMKIPSYIQMCMQHLYEKDGHLTIDEKPGNKADKIVVPVPEFLLILTDNVKGTGDDFDKFSATQMQDTSTLDRVNLNETLQYLDPKAELEMLMGKFPKADERVVTKLIKLAGLVRNGYRQGSIALTLSPRGLIAVLDMVMVANVPVNRAITLAYINKIADDAELIAIKDMMKTVGL